MGNTKERERERESEKVRERCFIQKATHNYCTKGKSRNLLLHTTIHLRVRVEGRGGGGGGGRRASRFFGLTLLIASVDGDCRVRGQVIRLIVHIVPPLPRLTARFPVTPVRSQQGIHIVWVEGEESTLVWMRRG